MADAAVAQRTEQHPYEVLDAGSNPVGRGKFEATGVVPSVACYLVDERQEGRLITAPLNFL